jgi:hypothetical protein
MRAADQISKVVSALRPEWASAKLIMIRSTNKSQVFRLQANSDVDLIVKRHEIVENFRRELWAYLLLKASGTIPMLIHYDESNRLLVFTAHEVEARSFHTQTQLCAFATTLGRAHGCIFSRLQYLNLAHQAQFAVEEISAEDWIINKKSWRSYISRINSIDVPMSEMISIGDLNINHVLLSENGYLLCDLETLNIRMPGVVDIAMIQNLCLQKEIFTKNIELISDFYVDSRMSIDPFYSTSSTTMSAMISDVMTAIALPMTSEN